MADAAAAITNGITESTIIIIIRGMCWFHCKKATDRQIVKVKDESKRSTIIQSIICLQLSQTPDIFKAASKLFLNEFECDMDEDVTIFIKYFKENWLDINSNWFESYNHPHNAGSISTNNGNESINGLIKREDTLRNLLSLNAFMSVAFGILRKWSVARDPSCNINAKPFVTEPSISLSLWTEAYNWKLNAIIIQDVEEKPNNFYFKSGNGVEINSIEIVRKYEKNMCECNWQTFESFRNCAFGIWRVTMPVPLTESNWKQGSCTCPAYFKKYLCKHIVGIALRQTLVTKASLLMPIQAKNIPIGSKRKVGRPALAKTALIMQQFRSIMEVDDNSNDTPCDQVYDGTLNFTQRENLNNFNRQSNNQLDVSVDIGNNFFGLLDNQPSTSTGVTSSTLNSFNINQMYSISHIESIEVNEATVATELLASNYKMVKKSAKRGRPTMTTEEKAEAARKRSANKNK